METRPLGRAGLQVSALCLGTMQFGWTADEETAHAILDRAFDAGVNFIDTADIYSRWVPGHQGGEAETILGRWLAKHPGRREHLVLATKVRGAMGPHPNDEGLSRVHILSAVEGSLRRLQVETIDLYQLHYPDDDTPIEETLAALDDLIHRGLVRYIGCSNFPAWRLMQALWASDRLGTARFVSLQPHYNLVHRGEFEGELREVCETYQLAVLPYSPLAAGFLTGKYAPGGPGQPRGRLAGGDRLRRYLADERAMRTMQKIQEIAAHIGAQPSQVALAWLLRQPGVTSPIIGPRTIEQLEDNLAALQVALSPAQLSELNRVSDGT